MFKNSNILITGGTGSWGQELTKQLLSLYPKKIIIFSRGEFSQVSMERKFNDKRLEFIIGDVRDSESINNACKNIDYIFHLAALKHVPVCEKLPMEAIKTNIYGTKNVIVAAINNKVKKVIDVSSDKAVSPINTYGMTKAIGEKLMINANDINNDTNFICIRSGNVIGTNGSVIPFFLKKIKENNSISITDKRMSRYFITLKDAINLILTGAKNGIGGEIFVTKMQSCMIEDLANVIIDLYGNKETKINIDYIRPGEKLYEVLISRDEVLNTKIYDGEYYIILPSNNVNIKHLYSHLENVGFPEYSSNDVLMNHDSIKDMLKSAGF